MVETRGPGAELASAQFLQCVITGFSMLEDTGLSLLVQFDSGAIFKFGKYSKREKLAFSLPHDITSLLNRLFDRVKHRRNKNPLTLWLKEYLRNRSQ